MARGKKTGGRAKGSKNKATLLREARQRVIAEKASSAGITPLEYMLKVMRNRKAKQGRRDQMAAASAPYIHARLASVEAKMTGSLTVVQKTYKFDDAG